MRVSPKRLAYKLKRYGVPHWFYPGWDSAQIDPYNGRSDFRGIILHHTAGVNSERYIAETNPYYPVRACHFLVNHDGEVVVMSGSGAYHAGRGGPWRFPSGLGRFIPKDLGNRHLYGIEIESLGKTARVNDTINGMYREQIVSTALLCAALLNAMRPGWRSLPVSRVIRHKDWAPSRKIDVHQNLDWWHEVIGIARRNAGNVSKTRREIFAFIDDHPNGRI